MDERGSLENAIAAIERNRDALGNDAAEAALAPLREKLALIEGRDPGSGERKLVSALFADIAGYTGLVSRGDPEKVRELVNSVFGALVPIVERYGGTVDKFIGDEIMALFGAPVAHEDDARRACLAAIAMRNAVAGLDPGSYGSLAMHFGIGTGLVVAGPLGGGGREGYSAVGNAVNRAARLAAKAEAGRILADEDTVAQAGPGLAFSALAPLALKGFELPQRVFELSGLSEEARPLPPAFPFTGREEELAILDRAFRSLSHPDAAMRRMASNRVVVISGEPGIGKTRLVRQWLDALGKGEEEDPDGSPRVAIVGTACSSYEAGSAFGLWTGLVESRAGIAAADDAATRSAKIASLVAGLGTAGAKAVMGLFIGAQPDASDEEAALPNTDESLDEAVEAASLILSSIAGQAALIFFLDSYHHCDPASRAVLSRLVSGAYKGPALWILATREGASGLALTEGLERIELGPLSSEACASAALTALGGDAQAVDLSMAGGNPLFLEELLRLSRPGKDTAAAMAKTPEGLGMPPALFAMIASRVDALPRAARESLRVAAVLGESFPEVLLAALTKQTEAGFLVDRGFLSRDPDSETLAFRQGLVREAVYLSLLKRSLMALHGRTARAIKEHYPEYARRHPEIMARHWHCSGELKKSLPYYKLAGERLYFRGCPEAASPLLQTGLQLSRETGSRIHEAEFASLLGSCLALGPKPESALERLDEALAIQRSMANASKEMAILRFRAFALSRAGRLGEAKAGLESVLGKAVLAGARKEEARALLDLSRLSGLDPVEALGHAERGLAIAHEIGAEALATRLSASLADRLEALGRIEEAETVRATAEAGR